MVIILLIEGITVKYSPFNPRLPESASGIAPVLKIKEQSSLYSTNILENKAALVRRLKVPN